jgi:hypothetical protein
VGARAVLAASVRRRHRVGLTQPERR